MALAARAVSGMPLVFVAVVHYIQPRRREGLGQLFSNAIGDFAHFPPCQSLNVNL